jgi:hypothetical protein
MRRIVQMPQLENDNKNTTHKRMMEANSMSSAILQERNHVILSNRFASFAGLQPASEGGSPQPREELNIFMNSDSAVSNLHSSFFILHSSSNQLQSPLFYVGIVQAAFSPSLRVHHSYELDLSGVSGAVCSRSVTALSLSVGTHFRLNGHGANFHDVCLNLEICFDRNPDHALCVRS